MCRRRERVNSCGTCNGTVRMRDAQPFGYDWSTGHRVCIHAPGPADDNDDRSDGCGGETRSWSVGSGGGQLVAVPSSVGSGTEKWRRPSGHRPSRRRWGRGPSREWAAAWPSRAPHTNERTAGPAAVVFVAVVVVTAAAFYYTFSLSYPSGSYKHFYTINCIRHVQ